MTLRAGMANLVKRTRALADAGTAEYTVGEDCYWADVHIQNILDSNRSLIIDSPLTWRPQSIGGSTVTYQIAQAGYRDFEEAASGTARWIVRDATGAEIGTANYTADYRSGQLNFTADQGGTAYYLTAYTYDVYAAAADLWGERLAHFADWYRFAADNQEFDRGQAFEHACKMEELLRGKAGQNDLSGTSGDVKISQFVRVDINA